MQFNDVANNNITKREKEHSTLTFLSLSLSLSKFLFQSSFGFMCIYETEAFKVKFFLFKQVLLAIYT